ncbi:HNH endonuclease [Ruminococcaceae bacterium OttesenSCG-928-I18]|nr:HNH endonuclease [Ruminococcaceae bacterium OttesenSCG-928-I18]
MREIWRDVADYEGLYRVSNLGNVIRLKSQWNPGTGKYSRPERVVTQRKNNKGYFMVDLWKNNCRQQCLVHRLVAQAFVDNPEHCNIVNHIDENKTNNCASNLEWCTQKHNMNHGTCPVRIGRANGKPVAKLDKSTGTILAIYQSAMAAERDTGIGNSRISECCLNRRKTAGGYCWSREGIA